MPVNELDSALERRLFGVLQSIQTDSFHLVDSLKKRSRETEEQVEARIVPQASGEVKPVVQRVKAVASSPRINRATVRDTSRRLFGNSEPSRIPKCWKHLKEIYKRANNNDSKEAKRAS